MVLKTCLNFSHCFPEIKNLLQFFKSRCMFFWKTTDHIILIGMVKHLNHLVPSKGKKQNKQTKITASHLICHVVKREHLNYSVVFSTHLNLRFSSCDIACPWLYNTPSRVSKSSWVGIVVVWQDLSNVNRTIVLLAVCHWTKTMSNNLDEQNPKGHKATSP